MFKLFSSRTYRRTPQSKRKLYAHDFFPVARLEILLNKYIELYQMDTGMSLDRDGFSTEQIDYYNKERWPFVIRHGQELLEYLRPYEAVPENTPLTYDESRRSQARSRLIAEIKKTESE